MISWYALKSFFKAQGIKIEEEAPIKRPRKRYLDQALSKDDIRQIIEYSPPHIKLAVALEAFSGPRPSDCVTLTFYDFLKQPDYIDGPPYLLHIREKKNQGMPYVTFFPEQTMRLLKQWKATRESNEGEVTDDTLVFRWASPKTMTKKIAKWIKKSGIKPRKDFRLRNYCLRKYFRRTMTGIVPEPLIEHFMGHDNKTDLPSIYIGLTELDKETILKARDEYMKAIPALVTDGGVDAVELVRLRDELRDKMEEASKADAEVEELRTRLERMEVHIKRFKREYDYMFKLAETVRDVDETERLIAEEQNEAKAQEILAGPRRRYAGPKPNMPPNIDYKQIKEGELINYLNDGWEIEYTLNNGSHQVIVKRVTLWWER